MKQAKTGQISLVIPIYFSYVRLGIVTTLQHRILMFIHKIHGIFTSLSYFVIDLINLTAKNYNVLFTKGLISVWNGTMNIMNNEKVAALWVDKNVTLNTESSFYGFRQEWDVGTVVSLWEDTCKNTKRRGCNAGALETHYEVTSIFENWIKFRG